MMENKKNETKEAPLMTMIKFSLTIPKKRELNFSIITNNGFYTYRDDKTILKKLKARSMRLT